MDECFSIGIHPMDVDSFSLPFLEQVQYHASNDRCLLLGECGLDKRSKAPLSVQLDFLERQIGLSERLRKPVILHVVRATDEIIRLKRQLRPLMPWILHGFRGKPQLAAEYLHEGFSLSFGFSFNPDALRIVPDDRLFLETDEDIHSIEQVLSLAAQARGQSAEELVSILENNAAQLWGSVHSLFGGVS